MWRVKNWAKFQHFKDRRPPWIKLYREILDDIEWHKLDPQCAKVLVMLWLIASEDEGRLPDSETLAFRLRLDVSLLKTIVSKLSHWLEHDDINAISRREQPPNVSDHQETETETEAEREGETERDAVARRRPKVRCPDQFEVNEAMATWAESKGLPSDRIITETEKFLAHHRSKDSLFKDWNQAWQSWIFKAVDFGARRST